MKDPLQVQTQADFPRRVAQTFKLVHLVLTFMSLAAHDWKFFTMDKPEYAKLLLLPRQQSRGHSFACQLRVL